MSALNEPQMNAAMHPSGPLLIFAGAGSGKTRTITYRICHLIAHHQVPPYRILAVTFTNKAAAEMRDRITSLAGEGIARDLWVGTFHGTAAKFLRRYPEEVGLDKNFVIYDSSDQKALLARIIKSKGLDDRRYAPKAMLAMIGAAKREGIDPAEEDIGDGFDKTLPELGRAYQEALGRCNAVDFDDLLLKILKIVENVESAAGQALRAKFDHVMVDEFQDTNMVQYRIVRALTAKSRNLCVVGDDDQSIYRWRGADVRIIRGFKNDFSETLVIKLEQNYRSTKNIVAAALAVIEKADDREPKELWTDEEDGERVVIHAATDERQEAAIISQGVAQANAAGVSAAELAIFYRIHAQSRVLEEAMRGAGVPYQIIGGMKFFERAEVKDMLSYLRLIENPRSDADLLRIINVPARGIGQKTVSKILDVAAEGALSARDAILPALKTALSGATAKKVRAFNDLISDFQVAKERLSPSELLESILEQTGYKRLLEKEDSAESDARLENLAELVGSLREYESETPETGEEASLTGYLERVSLVAAVDSMEDVPKVSLMTVHSAKGLEFERVWMSGMEEEIFPYKGFEDPDSEELDEERRLAYVAITRARKQLTITHTSTRFLFGRTRYQSPSRFIEDIPDAIVERKGDAKPKGLGGLAQSMNYQGATGSSGSGYRPAKRNAYFNEYDQSPSASAGGRMSAQSIKFKQTPGSDDAVDEIPEDEFADSIYEDVEPMEVRPGQSAHHKKFGKGVIERVEPGLKPTVVIRFPGHGPKRILAEFLQFG